MRRHPYARVPTANPSELAFRLELAALSDSELAQQLEILAALIASVRVVPPWLLARLIALLAVAAERLEVPR